MIMRKYTLLAGLLLLAGAATAQPVYTVQNVGLKNVNDSVWIHFDVLPGGKKIAPRSTLILTPVVRTIGRSEALPPVVFRGRLAEKIHSRNEVFSRRRPHLPDTNASLADATHYQAVIPFQEWMRNGGLVLNSQWYACKKDIVMEQSTLLAEPIPAPPLPPVVVVVEKPVVVEPVVLEVKKVTGNAYLDFPVGKSVIQPDFRNNARELAKIRHTLDSLLAAPNIRIKSIALVGYASPEGGTELNDRLAAERADALKSYLTDTYPRLPKGVISAQSGGEDWNGLEELVKASSLGNKTAILQVLDSDVTDAAKKAKIRSLGGGATYQTLLRDYYPRLRRVSYTVNFEILSEK